MEEKNIKNYPDFPKKANLRADLYRPLPNTHIIDPQTIDVAAVADNVLRQFSSALEARDEFKLRTLFFEAQAYFKDTVALTYHRRTFTDSQSSALALLELSDSWKASGFRVVAGSVKYLTMGSHLVNSDRQSKRQLGADKA